MPAPAELRDCHVLVPRAGSRAMLHLLRCLEEGSRCPWIRCRSDGGVGGWQSSGGSAGAATSMLWEGGTAAPAVHAAMPGSAKSLLPGSTLLSWRRQLSNCTRSIPAERRQLGICSPTCLEGAPGAVGGVLHLVHLKESWCVLINLGCFLLPGSSQPCKGAADVGSGPLHPQGIQGSREQSGCLWHEVEVGAGGRRGAALGHVQPLSWGWPGGSSRCWGAWRAALGPD